MKKVEEVDKVEIGKFYWVKCGDVESDSGSIIYKNLPIIGKSHTDPQFGVDFSHYHVDGRFTKMVVDNLGLTNCIYGDGKNKNIYHLTRIQYRKKKCIRTTTGIKPPPSSDNYDKWYQTFFGKSCKGKKCPHLGTKMLEHDGKLICPLHNLTGCVDKEIIIERHDLRIISGVDFNLSSKKL